MDFGSQASASPLSCSFLPVSSRLSGTVGCSSSRGKEVHLKSLVFDANEANGKNMHDESDCGDCPTPNPTANTLHLNSSSQYLVSCKDQVASSGHNPDLFPNSFSPLHASLSYSENSIFQSPLQGTAQSNPNENSQHKTNGV